MANSLEIYELTAIERVLRERDDDDKNHDKNLWMKEVESNIVDLKTAVIQSGKVTKETEAVAYNMVSDNYEVYNTAGGQLISENMPGKVKDSIKKAAYGVRSTDLDNPGNPDFVCVPKNQEDSVKFIEVKYNGDNLTKTQKEWFNKNKWAEGYILRIEKRFEFNESEILLVEDLVQAEGVERKNAKNLLTEPRDEEEEA